MSQSSLVWCAPLVACLCIAPAGAAFDTEHFTAAATCAVCHNGLNDATGADVSIETDWGASMMALSARDPLWQAKVASELARAPHLAEVINHECTHCHMPMAGVELDFEGESAAILDGPASGDGLLDPLHPLHAAAAEGVSCTLCHQIEDDGGLGTLEGASGGFSIAEDPERPLYGPVPGPRIDPMQRETGYTPVYAMHMGESEVCAVCHNLKTPFTDAAGTVLSTTPESEFAEQMPYTEWSYSDFAPSGATPRTCQSCHMPEVDGVALSRRPRNLRRIDGFSRHQFVGPNTTMLDILDRNRAELGVTSSGLPLATAAARDMLAGAAELELMQGALEGQALRLVLRVTNRSGHKLPTSFPSRRVWLHVRVTDANGDLVFESGRLRDDGSIDGADADSAAGGLEPHHETITDGGQVQIYEPVMGDSDGAVTYTLLRGATYLKDNRLPPAGFYKAQVPDDVKVRGAAASDGDFDNGSDLISYAIDARGKVPPYRVQVALNYQALSWPFLHDLFRDGHLPEVARFQALYEDQAILAETITSLEAEIGR